MASYKLQDGKAELSFHCNPDGVQVNNNWFQLHEGIPGEHVFMSSNRQIHITDCNNGWENKTHIRMTSCNHVKQTTH